MTWNAMVSVKCNGKLNETSWEDIKAWDFIEKVWSSSGHWDFEVELDSSVDNQDKLEKAVFQLRSQNWIADTETHWHREV